MKANKPISLASSPHPVSRWGSINPDSKQKVNVKPLNATKSMDKGCIVFMRGLIRTQIQTTPPKKLKALFNRFNEIMVILPYQNDV